MEKYLKVLVGLDHGEGHLVSFVVMVVAVVVVD